MAFRSWLGATNQLPAAVDERLAFETSTAQITFSWFFEITKGIRFPEKTFALRSRSYYQVALL